MWNGIGTYYLNWEHCGDGTSLATKWFALFYLPVLPLRRERIAVVSTGNDETNGIPLVYVSFTLRDEYAVMRTEPMAWDRVIWTYIFAYAIMPFVLAAPLIALIPLSIWLGQFQELWPTMIMLVMWLFYGVLYVPGLLAHQLHKSRAGT